MPLTDPYEIADVVEATQKYECNRQKAALGATDGSGDGDGPHAWCRMSRADDRLYEESPAAT
jgi:hypothetical protein